MIFRARGTNFIHWALESHFKHWEKDDEDLNLNSLTNKLFQTGTKLVKLPKQKSEKISKNIKLLLYLAREFVTK